MVDFRRRIGRVPRTVHLGILSFAVISAMVLGGVSTAIGGSLSQRGFGYGDVVPRTTLAVPVTLTNNSVGVDTSGSAVQVSQGAFQVGNVGGAVTLPRRRVSGQWARNLLG